MSEQNLDNPLGLLADVEEDIGRLYEAYAKNMPEHEEFWFGLVLKEGDHSYLIHNLASKYGNGTASSPVDDATIDKVTELRELLKRETGKAGKKYLSFTEALQTAINIEKYISDNSIYSLLCNSSCAEIDNVGKLNYDNTTLIKFLRKELKKYAKRKKLT
jgi:hypothetical protein